MCCWLLLISYGFTCKITQSQALLKGFSVRFYFTLLLITMDAAYNPQNEMFLSLKTKCFSQKNEMYLRTKISYYHKMPFE